VLYAALYESIAAHSRLGVNVAVDVGHYDGDVLADCIRRLEGLPVLFVGVRCPVEVIMERRRLEPGSYSSSEDAVLRWETAVHEGREYDLEVDTSILSPAQCADAIASRLAAAS
jgi:chloramphenicol 3-O phosphotransferase